LIALFGIQWEEHMLPPNRIRGWGIGRLRSENEDVKTRCAITCPCPLFTYLKLSQKLIWVMLVWCTGLDYT
jgi:hypothetical protein